jgi:pimeloyl-ACP methyl ester carboxylesterase
VLIEVHSKSNIMVTPTTALSAEQLCDTVLQIIAAELEVEPQELYDDHTEFAELGLDRNLASISVGKIKQKAGIQLPGGVFNDYPDVGLFKRHLLQVTRRPAAPAVSEATAPPPNPSRTTNGNKNGPSAPLSVLIRGNRTASTNTNLFLLPDGSGSAMGYARIPPLSQNHNLWALNSPFLGRGRSIDGFTIQGLASIWTEEILSIQPPGQGPYALGGWSAGGYYAFEVAKQLRARGLVVDKLVLIDSPSRTRFEAMPLAVVEHLSKHNLMGQGGQSKPAPAWLVDHFAATLKAVEAYVPSAIGPVPRPNAAYTTNSGDGGVTSPPEVFIIWAEDALLSLEEARGTGLDLNVRVSRFLLESRHEEDYGSGGWELLFPLGTRMSVATMPGHHFNIVHPPNVSILQDAWPVLIEFMLICLPFRWSVLEVYYAMLSSMTEKNRQIRGELWMYWRSPEIFSGAIGCPCFMNLF